MQSFQLNRIGLDYTILVNTSITGRYNYCTELRDIYMSNLDELSQEVAGSNENQIHYNDSPLRNDFFCPSASLIIISGE